MRIADTSLLYALFSENDVHHQEAMRKFKTPEPILIPFEIWSETISLIHYRQGYGMAVKADNALLSLSYVDMLGSSMDIILSS